MKRSAACLGCRCVPDLFNTLKDRLIRAGVRPANVSRYVAELRDHLDDLAAEGIANGLDNATAQQQALARLGNIDELAKPMIADRRFQSWASAIPWAVFLLVPVLGQIAIMAGTIFLLTAATSAGAVPPWFGAATIAAQYAIGGLVPVLTAWIIAAIALRQRSRPIWPMLGIGAVVCIGAMLHLPVVIPAPGQPGMIAMALMLPALAHLLALLGLATAPFFLNHSKART